MRSMVSAVGACLLLMGLTGCAEEPAEPEGPDSTEPAADGALDSTSGGGLVEAPDTDAGGAGVDDTIVDADGDPATGVDTTADTVAIADTDTAADAVADTLTVADTDTAADAVADTLTVADTDTVADAVADAVADTLTVADTDTADTAADTVADTGTAADTVADTASAADTADTTSACDATSVGGQCGCDAECTNPNRPICWRGRCLECSSDADCDAPARPSCWKGTCVPCTWNGDCSAETPVCDFNHTCVECLPSISPLSSPRLQACGDDEYCLPANKTCVTKKEAGADCQLGVECASTRCIGGHCTHHPLPGCEPVWPECGPGCPHGYYCDLGVCRDQKPNGWGCSYLVDSTCENGCISICSMAGVCSPGLGQHTGCDNAGEFVGDELGEPRGCEARAAGGEYVPYDSWCEDGYSSGCRSGMCEDESDGQLFPICL